MTRILHTQAQEYIWKNQHKGFDELAFDIRERFSCVGSEEETKDAVKEYWNRFEMGWKMFPKTMPKVSPLSHGDWFLEEDTTIYPCEGFPLVIKRGYRFDFASVPRIFWAFISPTDDGIREAALLHDVLYETQLFSRGVCDNLFLQGMKERRFPFFRRVLAFFSVRIFGLVPFYKRSKQEAEKARQTFLILGKEEKQPFLTAK